MNTDSCTETETKTEAKKNETGNKNNMIKKLCNDHKYKFTYPYIIETCCCRPLIKD